MRRISTLTTTCVLSLLLFTFGSISAAEQLGEPHVFEGAPISKSEKSKFHVLKNLAYDVGYSEEYGDPLWSSYHIQWTETPKKAPRLAKFLTDDRTDAKLTHEDYTQKKPTKYDRGHMTPNYAIVSRFGKEAQAETFLMSNVCPQRSTLNQQTWRYLESVVSNRYSEVFKDLWVISGPIFDKNPDRLNGKAAIPKAFFMIMVGKEATGEIYMLGVVMNQDVKGSQELRKFVKPVRDIEKETGLDFFSELPHDQQEKLETSEPDDIWELDQQLVPIAGP